MQSAQQRQEVLLRQLQERMAVTDAHRECLTKALKDLSDERRALVVSLQSKSSQKDRLEVRRREGQAKRR